MFLRVCITYNVFIIGSKTSKIFYHIYYRRLLLLCAKDTNLFGSLFFYFVCVCVCVCVCCLFFRFVYVVACHIIKQKTNKFLLLWFVHSKIIAFCRLYTIFYVESTNVEFWNASVGGIIVTAAICLSYSQIRQCK